MKIHELFEQTIAPIGAVPAGQGKPAGPVTPTVTAPANPAAQTATTTATTPGTTAPAVPADQQQGKNQQQLGQLAQQSKAAITNLDKIAAQIIGLKQQQQQMQQQLSK